MILREQALSTNQTGSGPFVFREMMQDGSYDDGWDFINAKYDLSIEANNGNFSTNDVAMRRMGGHLFRGAIDVAGSGATVPGAKVTYTPKATDRVGNSTTSTPKSFQIAGYLRYDVGAPGNNVIDANGVGTLNINTNATIVTTGCPSLAVGGLLWANGRGFYLNFAGFTGTLLLDIFTFGEGLLGSADAGGVMTIVAPVPNNPLLVGVTFDLQTFTVVGGDITFSNGLEATVGP
jgi:hypothetical protein